MKALAMLGMWVLAALVALAILHRVRRGRPLLVPGEGRCARFLGMVAAVLVFLGVGGASAPDAAAQEPATPASQDASQASPIAEGALREWSRRRSRRATFTALEQALAGGDAAAAEAISARARSLLPAALFAVVDVDLRARVSREPPPPVPVRALLLALDEMEAAGVFRPALHAAIWRHAIRSAAAAEPALTRRLFHRLHVHARIQNALTRLAFEIEGRASLRRAWASKAGPSRPRVDLFDEDALVRRFPASFRASDAGTWERDARLMLLGGPTSSGEGAEDGVRRHRGDETRPLGDAACVGRLDLVDTLASSHPVRVTVLTGRRGPELSLLLPPGRLLTVADLADLVDARSVAEIARAVARAIAEPAPDLDVLELILPIAVPAIRSALAASPDAPGAPALRLLLVLYDEALPVLWPPAPPLR